MIKMRTKSLIAKEIRGEIKNNGLVKLCNDFNKKFKTGELYLVGGVIRDIAIYRKKDADLDFVVRNVKATELKKFLSKYGKVNLVGKSFGVFKFRAKNSKSSHFVDFALPRTEHALGTGAYRDFKVQSNPRLTIKEDLSRRDFTINALAWDIKNKNLIDEFGGINDLRGKVIRTVGKPEERFSEDYSRMLRALRFATELEFEIESNTWKGIKKLIPEINKKKNGRYIVPREIIAKEFLKSFSADPLEALEWWDGANALAKLIPELSALKECKQPIEFHAEGNVWKHIHLCLEVLDSQKFKKEFNIAKPDLYVALGVLFHDIAKPKTVRKKSKSRGHISFPGHAAMGGKITREIVRRLKLESYKAEGINIEAKKLGWLVENHMFILGNDPKSCPENFVYEYFMQKDFPKDYLLKISYCDIHGSKMGSSIANVYELNYFGYKERIRKLEKRFPRGVPGPIVDGTYVMEALNIQPSPKVNKILKEIREEQLAGRIKTKSQAKKYLLSHKW